MTAKRTTYAKYWGREKKCHKRSEDLAKRKNIPTHSPSLTLNRHLKPGLLHVCPTLYPWPKWFSECYWPRVRVLGRSVWLNKEGGGGELTAWKKLPPNCKLISSISSSLLKFSSSVDNWFPNVKAHITLEIDLVIGTDGSNGCPAKEVIYCHITVKLINFTLGLEGYWNLQQSFVPEENKQNAWHSTPT